MKNYKILLSIFACSTVAMFNMIASADNDKAGVVTVVRLQGAAEYSLDGGQVWTPVVVGKYFVAGTLIRSGDRSIVDLMVGKPLSDKEAEFLQFNARVSPAKNFIPLEEHNMIRLRPNTTLGIDKLAVSDTDASFVSDAELNLKKGRIFASVKKVSPSSAYLIKIPDGVAAVRGTQLELDTDGSASSCSVASGTVWLSFTVTGPDGKPVLGPDGQPFPPVQVTINPGQSFNLTQALLSNLSQQLSNPPGGTQGGQDQLTALEKLIVGLATSTITTLDMAQQDIIGGEFLPGTTITVTTSQTQPSQAPISPNAPVTIQPIPPPPVTPQ